VADRGSADLRFFGPGGKFLQRVGGDGEGPGEFRRLEFIGLLQGDSLATYDGSLRRVQVFDPSGVLSRTFTVVSPWPTAMPDKVIGVVGGFLMAIRFIDFGTVVPNGIVRWPHELVATMDLRTGALDSIRMVPGSEASVEAREGGGYSHGRYTFAKGNEFAAEADRMAIISTDTFSVNILGLDGSTELIVRRPVVPEAATEEDLRRYIEGYLALVFPEGSNPVPEDVENFRRGLLNTPSAATLPILRSVQLDSEGNIWVEMYFSPGEDPPPYQIFASDGTWLGEVVMPKGLDRGFIPYQAPSYQIGSEFILGVWKDELDVQYVRLYGLEKQ